LTITGHATATIAAAATPSSQKWLPVTTTTYDVKSTCAVN